MSEPSKDTKDDGAEKKYPLVYVRGLAMPRDFISIPEVERLMDYKPTDEEIFIVTYPKCGTTWTQFLVWEVMHKGAPPPSPNQIMFQHIPFMEFTGLDILENLPKPRAMKTHLPYNLQPKSPFAKLIYIVRNPWDCCVSYYYHHLIDPIMPKLTFDEYLQLFIKGEVEWGDFFDHVLSWFEHRKDPNVLFLTYEDMKKDTRKALLQIAKFLGKSYYEDLQDKKVQDDCLKHSDFKYMKQLGMFFPKDITNKKEEVADIMKQFGEVDRSAADKGNFQEVPFFRKGIVGDWKNHFSPEQIKLLNDCMIKKLKNTEMENYWKPIEEETSL